MAMIAVFVVVGGLLTQTSAIVAWGGAMLLGLLTVRELTRLAIVRSRLAGFEMSWKTEARVHSMARSAEILLEIDLWNRDRVDARFAGVRPVAASSLSVQARPIAGLVPRGAALTIALQVKAHRAGRHAVHGLLLELEGPLGLFTVPLGFASPIGIEVLPRAAQSVIENPRGGRARKAAFGRTSRSLRGDGSELFELRQHVAGDPFKRIAWKASARRSQLMVKELEREDRDVVWLVLDASTELWAGPPGRAPLDSGIEALAAIASRHASRGDSVGAVLAGMGPDKTLAPQGGPSHAARLVRLLALEPSTFDADRSDMLEEDVARMVLDHLRFLDPNSVRLRSHQLDAIAASCEAARKRAPFQVDLLRATTPRERTLRSYLASFGVNGPPRIHEDRGVAERAILGSLERIAEAKPRATVIYVYAPPPSQPDPALLRLCHRLRRQKATLRWISPLTEHSLPAPGENPDDNDVAGAAAFAVGLRARTARLRGEQLLRSAGVKISLGGIDRMTS